MLSKSQVRNRVEFLSQNKFNPRIGAYINKSWNIVRSFPAQFVGVTFLFILTLLLPSAFKNLGYFALEILFSYVSFFASFITIVALFNAAHLAKYGRYANFKMLLNYNGKFFVLLLAVLLPFILAMIFVVILMLIPFISISTYIIGGTLISIFCILITGFSYIFLVPLYLFTEVDVLEAFIIGGKILSRSWFRILLFFIATIFVCLGGLLVCGIGILFTYPMCFVCYYLYFYDMMGIGSVEDPLETIGRGVEYRDESIDF